MLDFICHMTLKLLEIVLFFCLKTKTEICNVAMTVIIWASTQENLSSVFANNKGAYTQCDKRLCYSLIGKYHM